MGSNVLGTENEFNKNPLTDKKDIEIAKIREKEEIGDLMTNPY